MDIVYHKAKNIIKTFIRDTISDYQQFDRGDDTKTLTAFIIKLVHDYRLYSLYTPSDASKLWNEIRNEELLTDFVLKLRVDLLSHLTTSEYDDLVEGLINDLTFHQPKTELCLIDDVLKDRLPSQAFLTNLFDYNSWIVPLYLISLSSTSRLLFDE